MSDWIYIAGVDIGVRKVSVVEGWVRYMEVDFTVDSIALNSRESKERDMAEAWLALQDWLDLRIKRDDMKEHKVFIEEPPYVHNHRTAMLLSATYGVVSTVFASNGFEVLGVPVSEWKKVVVGKGNATKEEVRRWAVEMWPNIGVESLSQDEIDALAVFHYGIETTRKEQGVIDELSM